MLKYEYQNSDTLIFYLHFTLNVLFVWPAKITSHNFASYTIVTDDNASTIRIKWCKKDDLLSDSDSYGFPECN